MDTRTMAHGTELVTGRKDGVTHDAVRRRAAADETLDLTPLPIEHLLGLGARDSGRTCGEAGTLNHHNVNM